MEKREYETPQESYDHFWKDLVEVDGKMDEELVKAELHDYHFVIDQVPKVYDAVSGGRISKPNTYAYEVIGEFERHFLNMGIAHDDVEDMISRAKTLKDLVEELRDYFVEED